MNKEEMIQYFNHNFIKQGSIYTYENLPMQIGNAIYLFGSNNIKDIILFIDLSKEQYGSRGLLLTTSHIYFQLDTKGSFSYCDITALSLEKHRHDCSFKGIVKTNHLSYEFLSQDIDAHALIEYLSDMTDINVNMIMTNSEKIDYYTSLVLNDIQNDEYEDVVLTADQQKQLHEFYQELNIIHSLDDSNYQYELELLLPKVLQFFDELELDSDEIDILEDLYKSVQNDQAFDQAKNYYDDMMHKYQQGDTSMFDQMKGMMNTLGINLDDLKNKSPQELDQYIDELCDRFHISRSQIDALSKKFR